MNASNGGASLMNGGMEAQVKVVFVILWSCVGICDVICPEATSYLRPYARGCASY